MPEDETGGINNVPKITRRLFDFGQETPPPVEAEQKMDDPLAEAKHVVQRLAAVFEEHRVAASRMDIDFGSKDLKLVIGALRDHAKGGEGLPVLGSRDEIHGYCLNRLFEELVEEPSNILYATKKNADTIKYDAMNSAFWIDCLDIMEAKFCP